MALPPGMAISMIFHLPQILGSGLLYITPWVSSITCHLYTGHTCTDIWDGVLVNTLELMMMTQNEFQEKVHITSLASSRTSRTYKIDKNNCPQT